MIVTNQSISVPVVRPQAIVNPTHSGRVILTPTVTHTLQPE